MPGPSSTGRLFAERGFSNQSSLFDDQDIAPSNGRESALALLRFADLGIDDVQIVEDSSAEPQASTQVQREPRRLLRLLHRVAGQELPFDLNEESAGTQMWFSLIGPTLSVLRSGRVLLLDEIDASLHPRLSARLLELFQDPETNPNGAQLIFTTHDTSLLNHLNRDEVWLTEKGDGGATTLTALAEYGGDKVRRSLNLEKAYLQGRFGAVPELDQFRLRRALGLVSRDA
jgi:predicted ATPase